MDYSKDLNMLNFLTNLSLLAFLICPIAIAMILYYLINNCVGPLWKAVVPYGVKIRGRD